MWLHDFRVNQVGKWDEFPSEVFLFSPWWFSLRHRGQLRRCNSVRGAICRATTASVQVVHQHRGAFYVRGRQSGKQLGILKTCALNFGELSTLCYFVIYSIRRSTYSL